MYDIPLRYAGTDLTVRRLRDDLENDLRSTRCGHLILTLARTLSRLQRAGRA